MLYVQITASDVNGVPAEAKVVDFQSYVQATVIVECVMIKDISWIVSLALLFSTVFNVGVMVMR